MILLRLFYLKDEAACYSFQYKLKKGCDIEEDLVSFERLSKLALAAFIPEMRGRSKAKEAKQKFIDRLKKKQYKL